MGIRASYSRDTSCHQLAHVLALHTQTLFHIHYYMDLRTALKLLLLALTPPQLPQLADLPAALSDLHPAVRWAPLASQGSQSGVLPTHHSLALSGRLLAPGRPKPPARTQPHQLLPTL